ncbi:hypothetical protein E1B28_013640 [Marasmius oreades]|uniref:Uncharacterized protein n=1 Tax=Marasmius oreades TaxID=181124 RepID=A0A9P7UN01_9AGAR|nr:uncharacterized protein E1B28_013640 [Marasmius oreades]KAG7087693.1 hypothetical protein E1B28_013640 [Marasmius oreades]
MESSSTSSSSASPSKLKAVEPVRRCNHPESRFLVRCGCPNDKPPSHPMHSLDDAFHREWCSKCLLFCYQPPTCPYILRTERRALTGRHFIRFMYAFIARLFRSFAGCISLT